MPESKQLFSTKIVDYTTCPSDFDKVSVCGSVLDFGLTLHDDKIEQNMQVQHGVASFDQFFSSILGVFQIITLDNWSLLMYNLANGSFMPLIPYLYCVVLVFLGNYFMLNLMLAVVLESYLKSEIETDKEIKEQLLQKQNYIDRQCKLEPKIEIEMIPQEQESFQEESEQKNIFSKLITAGISKIDKLDQTNLLSPLPCNKLKLSRAKNRSFNQKSLPKLVPDESLDAISHEPAPIKFKKETSMMERLTGNKNSSMSNTMMNKITASTRLRFGNKILDDDLKEIHDEIAKVKDHALRESLKREILSKVTKALSSQDDSKFDLMQKGIII